MANRSCVSISLQTRLILLLLAATLSLPVIAGCFTNHQERSNWENRPLAPFPQWDDWKDIKKSVDDINKFTNDHIGFSLSLNRLYRKFRFYIFSDGPIQSITAGSSGFIYLNSHNQQKSHTVFEALCMKGDNQKGIQERVDILEAIFSRLEARGYRASFGIPVSKPVLYPEKLPPQVPRRYRES